MQEFKVSENQIISAGDIVSFNHDTQFLMTVSCENRTSIGSSSTVSVLYVNPITCTIEERPIEKAALTVMERIND